MKKTEGIGRHASYNKHLRPFGKRWANKKIRRFAKKQIDRQIGRSDDETAKMTKPNSTNDA